MWFVFQTKCKISNFTLKTEFHLSYFLALFTNFRVMTAMLLIMEKLNVIVKSGCVNTLEFQKIVKSDEDSAIKEHLLFCNQSPDFEDFSILTTNNNDFKVTSMESLLANRDHPL